MASFPPACGTGSGSGGGFFLEPIKPTNNVNLFRGSDAHAAHTARDLVFTAGSDILEAYDATPMRMIVIEIINADGTASTTYQNRLDGKWVDTFGAVSGSINLKLHKVEDLGDGEHIVARANHANQHSVTRLDGEAGITVSSENSTVGPDGLVYNNYTITKEPLKGPELSIAMQSNEDQADRVITNFPHLEGDHVSIRSELNVENFAEQFESPEINVTPNNSGTKVALNLDGVGLRNRFKSDADDSVNISLAGDGRIKLTVDRLHKDKLVSDTASLGITHKDNGDTSLDLIDVKPFFVGHNLEGVNGIQVVSPGSTSSTDKVRLSVKDLPPARVMETLEQTMEKTEAIPEVSTDGKIKFSLNTKTLKDNQARNLEDNTEDGILQIPADSGLLKTVGSSSSSKSYVKLSVKTDEVVSAENIEKVIDPTSTVHVEVTGSGTSKKLKLDAVGSGSSVDVVVDGVDKGTINKIKLSGKHGSVEANALTLKGVQAKIGEEGVLQDINQILIEDPSHTIGEGVMVINALKAYDKNNNPWNTGNEPDENKKGIIGRFKAGKGILFGSSSAAKDTLEIKATTNFTGQIDGGSVSTNINKVLVPTNSGNLQDSGRTLKLNGIYGAITGKAYYLNNITVTNNATDNSTLTEDGHLYINIPAAGSGGLPSPATINVSGVDDAAHTPAFAAASMQFGAGFKVEQDAADNTKAKIRYKGLAVTGKDPDTGATGLADHVHGMILTGAGVTMKQEGEEDLQEIAHVDIKTIVQGNKLDGTPLTNGETRVDITAFDHEDFVITPSTSEGTKEATVSLRIKDESEFLGMFEGQDPFLTAAKKLKIPFHKGRVCGLVRKNSVLAENESAYYTMWRWDGELNPTPEQIGTPSNWLFERMALFGKTIMAVGKGIDGYGDWRPENASGYPADKRTGQIVWYNGTNSTTSPNKTPGHWYSDGTNWNKLKGAGSGIDITGDNPQGNPVAFENQTNLKFGRGFKIINGSDHSEITAVSAMVGTATDFPLWTPTAGPEGKYEAREHEGETVYERANRKMYFSDGTAWRLISSNGSGGHLTVTGHKEDENTTTTIDNVTGITFSGGFIKGTSGSNLELESGINCSVAAGQPDKVVKKIEVRGDSSMFNIGEENELNLLIWNTADAANFNTLKNDFPPASNPGRIGYTHGDKELCVVDRTTTEWQTVGRVGLPAQVDLIGKRYPEIIADTGDYTEELHKRLDYVFVNKTNVNKPTGEGGLGIAGSDQGFLHNIYGGEGIRWRQVFYEAGTDNVWTRSHTSGTGTNAWTTWKSVSGVSDSTYSVLVIDNDKNLSDLTAHDYTVPYMLHTDPEANIIFDDAKDNGTFRVRKAGKYNLSCLAQFTWEPSKAPAETPTATGAVMSLYEGTTSIRNMHITDNIYDGTKKEFYPVQGKFTDVVLKEGVDYTMRVTLSHAATEERKLIQFDPFKNILAIDPATSTSKSAERIQKTLYRSLGGISFQTGTEVRTEPKDGASIRVFGEEYLTEIKQLTKTA